jgi:hypothetical protein
MIVFEELAITKRVRSILEIYQRHKDSREATKQWISQKTQENIR